MKDNRFALATHILALLAIEEPDGPISSEYLAESAATNPVVVRRLLGQLRQAGLVTARLGAGGGASLARPAAEISLLAVYRAVAETELFFLGTRQLNLECICSRNIRPVLQTVFSQAEQAVERTFAVISIASIAGQIEQREAGLTGSLIGIAESAQ